MDTKDITSIHVGNTEIQKIVVGGGYCMARNYSTWSYDVDRRKFTGGLLRRMPDK